MAILAIIEHGVKPGYDCVDETGLLVKKLDIKPTREYIERKTTNRMVGYVRAENPILTMEFSGAIVPDGSGNAIGFANQHPGTTIASLANFQGTGFHGFAPADGKIIYTDPTRSLSDGDEEPMVSFTAKQYPGIAP